MNREKVMVKILNIIPRGLIQSSCNIESITISYVINNTIGTIMLSIDRYHIASLLTACFPLVTMAINRYFSLKNNLITEFQLTSTTVDIGLKIVPFIVLSKDNKKLLDIIND